MASLPNATFGSPANSFYAPYNQSASNWYNFSSLTGKVYLQDSNGVQVLQAIGGDLFFNDELLAKAGDLQNISDWSLYPALSTVYMNQQSTLGVSLLEANEVSTLTLLATTANVSGVVQAGVLATVPGPYAPGDVKTNTVTASGTVSASNVQAASIATTGGLDMTNTAITRASAVNISNQGVAPYGALTSPDGVMLTWNGAEVKTGAAGNVSQWANFPAVSNVAMAGYNINNAATINATTGNLGTMSLTSNTISGGTGQDLIITSQGTLSETTPNGTINRTAYNSINDNAGTSYNLTVDRFLTPLGAPINITAQNGLGGNIQILAKQSATIPGQGSIGYGQVGISALGSANAEFGLGGKIDITAYSGGVGEYGGATSRVSVGAATVALSAGAAPALPGLAGSMNVFGNGAVSIVCDLVPPVLPQVPETVYIFGRGAIRMETGSAFGVDGGVQMLSDTYAGNIYPITDSDLILQGRTAPNGYVKIRDCNEFTMTSGGIAQINTIQAVGSATDAVTINVIQGNQIVANTSNLTITGKVNTLVPDYLVEIQKADTIAFDLSGAGAITGLQKINGAAYIAPNTNEWALYKAVQAVDISGYGLVNVSSLSNVSSINGAAYPPPTTNVADWSLFPALQTVDLSGYAITLVSSIGMTGEASITNLSTINGVAYPAPSTITSNWATYPAVQNVDLSGHNIINVTDIDGVAGTPLTLNSSSDIALEAANDAYVEAQTGSANINAQIDANVVATAGAINLTGATGIQLNSATTIGTVGTPESLTVNGSILASTINSSGDVVSGYGGSNPYSLNKIGQLVTTPQTYNYWVAVNGSDSTGTGSVTNPFASITAALAATASLADGIPVNINVTAGTYTENPTITRNNTFIIGTPTVSDVVIIGTLSLTPAASAQPLITQGASGLTVVGNVICSEVVNTEVNWYMANVNVTSYGVAALSCTGDVNNNCSITLNNCVITQNTTNSAAIQLVSCRANLVLVSVAQNTASPALSLFSGNSSVAANGATFTCAGTALAGAVVFINNTISAGSLNTFTSCSFIYTAATAGSAKTAVQFNNAVAANAVFNYCVFSVGGSTNIISKTGIGTTNVQWGHNTCSPVSTVPATSATLTYSYSAQDFIRANTLRDSANVAGTANQVLTAGSAGSSLTWASLGASSLGALATVPPTTAYQNSLVLFNTATNTLSYDTAGWGYEVFPRVGTPLTLQPQQRGRTFIITSTGAQSQSVAAGVNFSINDTNFWCRIRNGNGTNGGDITLTGVAGNNVVHNQTSTQNGQEVILTYDGTRFTAY